MKAATRRWRPWTALALSCGVVVSPLSSRAGPTDATPSRAMCDPDLSAVDTAIKSRNAGQADQAKAILGTVLKNHPNNFRANYVMATVLIQEGGAQGRSNGLNLLVQTEKQLHQQPVGCIKLFGWYSIYNTLGVQYYKIGNRAKALSYFAEGYTHLDDMVSSTKKQITANLGLYYFTDGDLKTAKKYYEEAARFGDTKAAAHVTAITSVESSAKEALR